MSSYRICSLYSGSSGNAMLLITPRAKILIDAGKTARALTDALSRVGVSPDELDAIVITHDHRDHVGALPVFLKRHDVPVHIVKASAQALTFGEEGQLWQSRLCEHPPIYQVTVGDVRVQSFPTPHDSSYSVGYRLEIDDGNGHLHPIGYATDVGYVSDDVRAGLLGCECVVLESNHDRDMLLTGPYPAALKERILSRYGHLSNEDCAALAAELFMHGTQHFLLAHLSEHNNTPALAYHETLMALGEDVQLAVASPDETVELCVTMTDGKEERAC